MRLVLPIACRQLIFYNFHRKVNSVATPVKEHTNEKVGRDKREIEIKPQNLNGIYYSESEEELTEISIFNKQESLDTNCGL